MLPMASENPSATSGTNGGTNSGLGVIWSEREAAAAHVALEAVLLIIMADFNSDLQRFAGYRQLFLAISRFQNHVHKSQLQRNLFRSTLNADQQVGGKEKQDVLG